MLPDTNERVSVNTADAVNQRLRQKMEDRLLYFEKHPSEIGARLEELDREWDTERTLETNASILALAGVTLGATIDRRWLALPMLVTGFLLQHALQGWCPPLPILRRLGIQTAAEIDEERFALKALRGDFNDLRGADGSGTSLVRKVLRAIRA
ncbi:MAG: hypothetical protein AB7O49_18345 [Sphingomonadales bacterium]